MEYRGIQYEVVQTANPTRFKRVVHIDSIRTRTGESYSRKTAVLDAERAIDKALKAAPKPN
jgi:hypothetical protein